MLNEYHINVIARRYPEISEETRETAYLNCLQQWKDANYPRLGPDMVILNNLLGVTAKNQENSYELKDNIFVVLNTPGSHATKSHHLVCVQFDNDDLPSIIPIDDELTALILANHNNLPFKKRRGYQKWKANQSN